MKREFRIWSIVYTTCNHDKVITDLTKTEAKKIWGGIMDSYGKNVIMSGECKQAYLQRNGKVIAMKNDEYWFVNGNVINGLYEDKEQALALI